jgi:hypothetical protein
MEKRDERVRGPLKVILGVIILSLIVAVVSSARKPDRKDPTPRVESPVQSTAQAEARSEKHEAGVFVEQGVNFTMMPYTTNRPKVISEAEFSALRKNQQKLQ